MRRRVDAGTILLLTPVLWGATFPATKIALRHLPVLPFTAWSRTLGVLTVLALLPLFRPATHERLGALRRAAGPGLLLGVLMFGSYVLQTEGQARTSATNAGFITGMYVVFAPLLAAIVFGIRIPSSIWLAIAISLSGLTLLSVEDPSLLRLGIGDLLVMGGALGWAGHVVAIGRFSPRHSAWALSIAQLGVAAVLHAALALAVTGLRPAQAAALEVWPLLVVTGILGSGVAFTVQVLAQRTVTAERAVVLLAGESLFAAFFAAVWIGERLRPHQWLGAALVLTAMALSELAARRPTTTRVDPAAP